MLPRVDADKLPRHVARAREEHDGVADLGAAHRPFQQGAVRFPREPRLAFPRAGIGRAGTTALTRMRGARACASVRVAVHSADFVSV